MCCLQVALGEKSSGAGDIEQTEISLMSQKLWGGRRPLAQCGVERGWEARGLPGGGDTCPLLREGEDI